MKYISHSKLLMHRSFEHILNFLICSFPDKSVLTLQLFDDTKINNINAWSSCFVWRKVNSQKYIISKLHRIYKTSSSTETRLTFHLLIARSIFVFYIRIKPEHIEPDHVATNTWNLKYEYRTFEYRFKFNDQIKR